MAKNGKKTTKKLGYMEIINRMKKANYDPTKAHERLLAESKKKQI